MKSVKKTVSKNKGSIWTAFTAEENVKKGH